MNSLRLPMGIPTIGAERLDALSFTVYIKNIGRGYQRQAIELVNACRTLTETSAQEGRHLARLKSTMSVTEEALRSAVEAGKAVTDKTSSTFRAAEESLLQYIATVHPRSQGMDAMIAERMSRAREKDEQSLRLFNQLRDRRGANVGCPRTADVSSEKPCTSSASTPPNVPSSTCDRAEGGQPSPTVPGHGNTEGAPHPLTYKDLLPSTSPELPTSDFSSTATAACIPPASVEQGSQEILAHTSSSDIVPSPPGSQETLAHTSLSDITSSSPGPLETLTHTSSSSNTIPPQSSPEISDPRGAPPTTVQEPPETVSSIPDLPPHLTGPSTLRSPSLLTSTESPSGFIDVAPSTTPGRGNGTTQPSHTKSTVPSDPLPRSAEKKALPTKKQSQNKINRPTRGARSPTPSAKATPTAILPNTPKLRQSSIRLMPGAYPGMSVDVDISSWVLISPVSPSVDVSPKISWITRLFSLRG